MEKWSFKSSIDGVKIKCFFWRVKNPKALFVIVHGSLENSLHHRRFIEKLVAEHYNVAAIDLRGHGATGEKGIFGYFAKKNGPSIVLNDIKEFIEILKKQEDNLGLPIVLFGHSMGSFIVRTYISKYDDASYAILSGTCHTPKTSLGFLKFFARIFSFFWPKEPARFMHAITYKTFNLKFRKEGKNAWITSDAIIRNEAAKIPNTFGMLTNQGFYDMLKWIEMMKDKSLAKNINKNIKLLFISGKDDPVGFYGYEVKRAYNFYKKKFKLDATMILYDKMRHEPLNEIGRDKVYEDIFMFLNKK